MGQLEGRGVERPHRGVAGAEAAGAGAGGGQERGAVRLAVRRPVGVGDQPQVAQPELAEPSGRVRRRRRPPGCRTAAPPARRGPAPPSRRPRARRRSPGRRSGSARAGRRRRRPGRGGGWCAAPPPRRRAARARRRRRPTRRPPHRRPTAARPARATPRPRRTAPGQRGAGLHQRDRPARPRRGEPRQRRTRHRPSLSIDPPESFGRVSVGRWPRGRRRPRWWWRCRRGRGCGWRGSAATPRTPSISRGGRLGVTEVVEHHHRRPHGADRVGDPLSGDVGRRAVHRLEHRRVLAGRVEVGRRRDADAAGDRGGEVAEDVAEQVGGHDHVEPLRLEHDLGRRARRCARSPSGRRGSASARSAHHLVPERHRVHDPVALGGRGDVAAPRCGRARRRGRRSG